LHLDKLIYDGQAVKIKNMFKNFFSTNTKGELLIVFGKEVIDLSRNFGKEIVFAAGIDFSSREAAIPI
jgi:hypothetical protein